MNDGLAEVIAQGYADALDPHDLAPLVRKHIALEIHMAICTDPDCPDQSSASEAVEIVMEGFEP